MVRARRSNQDSNSSNGHNKTINIVDGEESQLFHKMFTVWDRIIFYTIILVIPLIVIIIIIFLYYQSVTEKPLTVKYPIIDYITNTNNQYEPE